MWVLAVSAFWKVAWAASGNAIKHEQSRNLRILCSFSRLAAQPAQAACHTTITAGYVTGPSGRVLPPAHRAMSYRRRRNSPSPTSPVPSSAIEIGSGTALVLALAVPLTAAVNGASELPRMLTLGVTLEKLRLSASGEPRALAGITPEVKETVSPGVALEAVKVSPVPLPKRASVNDPVR